MLNWSQIHKFEEIKETGSGPAPVVAAATPAPETDDLGYEVAPAKTENTDVKAATDKANAEAAARAAAGAANDAAASAEKPIDPATGYGDEPPKVEEAAPPTEPPVATDLGYELKAEGLPKEEVDKVASIAKKHNLSQEIAQDLLNLRKSELQAAEEMAVRVKNEQEAERIKTRVKWHKELKEDPHFGGEKFGFNVMQAEKVVQEFMPNTKKVLTERKSMLPPYVMRDLAKLASTLYATEKLQGGEVVVPPKKDSVDEALEFYN